MRHRFRTAEKSSSIESLFAVELKHPLEASKRSKMTLVCSSLQSERPPTAGVTNLAFIPWEHFSAHSRIPSRAESSRPSRACCPRVAAISHSSGARWRFDSVLGCLLPWVLCSRLACSTTELALSQATASAALRAAPPATGSTTTRTSWPCSFGCGPGAWPRAPDCAGALQIKRDGRNCPALAPRTLHLQGAHSPRSRSQSLSELVGLYRDDSPCGQVPAVGSLGAAVLLRQSRGVESLTAACAARNSLQRPLQVPPALPQSDSFPLPPWTAQKVGWSSRKSASVAAGAALHVLKPERDSGKAVARNVALDPATAAG